MSLSDSENPLGKKLLLVDGMALVHRGYWAIKERYAGSGEQTNAVYGFLTMFLGILEREKPDMVAVCFEGGKTFRNALYPGYKAGRKPAPDDLKAQVPRIQEILEAMGVPAISEAGLEADDLIGVLSYQAERRRVKTLVLTGDKDLLQLVSPLTLVAMPVGGYAPFKYYNESEVLAKFGFYPKHIPDYKAIAGDPSDCIPGVAGIGEKGAISLISRYGSVESIQTALIPKNPAEYTKEEKLFAAGLDSAILFKKLTTITRQHAGVSFNPYRFSFPECDLSNVKRALDIVDLGGLYSKFYAITKGII